MVRLIERRANEIVHGRIDDDKRLLTIVLGEKNATQQKAGLGNDGTSGLEHDGETQSHLLSRAGGR